jgi:hypothetical protein
LQLDGLIIRTPFDPLGLKLANTAAGLHDYLWYNLRDPRIGKRNSPSRHKGTMGFLRTLFLGVYASNAAIRVLFMPLCYVLLLSPFFTLVGWYFGFDRTLSAYAPEDFTWTDLLPQIVLSAVFLLLPTRLISHWANASKGSNGGKRRVQSLPYWIPGFRNFWSLVSGGERWLRGVR